MSEANIACSNSLYFSGKLYKCLGVVLGYFHDLLLCPLEARGEAASKLLSYVSNNTCLTLTVMFFFYQTKVVVALLSTS